MSEEIKTPTPHFEIEPEQVSVLNLLTMQLRHDYARAPSLSAQEMLLSDDLATGAKSIDAAKARGEDSEGLALAFYSLALGALPTTGAAPYTISMLRSNTLINDTQTAFLAETAHVLMQQRERGVPDDQSSFALHEYIGGQLTLLDKEVEAGGEERPAFKIALLGFATGATLSRPDLPDANLFIQELKNQTASKQQ